jgi:cytochrome c-type biogenesis protein CcmH
LAPGERKHAHAEAARRLLAAVDHAAKPWSASPSVRGAVLAVAILAAALALGGYLAVGAPGAADQPFARRLAAWRDAGPERLDAAQLAAVLKMVSGERPRDPEVLRFRALAQMSAGDVVGAERSLRRALELAPARVDLWEALGEVRMVMAQGEVSADAQAAFAEALKRDPKAQGARYHLARAQIDTGDRAAGIAGWRALLADLAQDDPRRPALAAAIAQAEKGPAPQLPDRSAIRGMVEGLAARLEVAPDDPNGWVRLVRSYAVLGEAARRDAAFARAKGRFGSRPDVMADLEAAAKAPPMATKP